MGDTADPPSSPLALPADVEVVMVGELRHARECFAELMRREEEGEEGAVVGCDVEWCPKTKTLSIMQLATRKR